MPKPIAACVSGGVTLAVLALSTLSQGAGPQKPPINPPMSPQFASDSGAGVFRRDVQPPLQKYCYPCHGGGEKAGNVAFDSFSSYAALRQNHALFGKVLKNLRSGTMPPSGMDQPTAAEKQSIEAWIKTSVFRIDPANPDPGRVTVRRLNRVEYRNTIRDLIGVDFDTQTEFPADDTGHGFDTIGDALSLSPLLIEKYLNAAQAIVAQAVPTTARVVAEKEIPGSDFAPESAGAPAGAMGATVGETRDLSYYEPASVSHSLTIARPGDYQLVLDLSANERYVDNQFDYNRCRLIIRVDKTELFRKEFNREGGKPLRYVFDRKQWPSGEHTVSFEVEPILPKAEEIRSLTLRINKVTVRGPIDDRDKVEPARYRTFFPRPVPAGAARRTAYAREILGKFAGKAFRRPVDAPTLTRLTQLAQSVYTEPGQTFEGGIAQAMVAVLASPRFLFREEGVVPGQEQKPAAMVDEYALASRLSYFFWSSMPDDTLLQLASQNKLRASLPAQTRRLLADPRSQALIENFSGQWLQTRDIEKSPINPRAVLERERDPAAAGAPGAAGGGFRRPRVLFDEALRKSLRGEADSYFGYVVRSDRSVLELLDSNFTFLNERLAQYYGLTGLGIQGEEFRKVTLPPGSPRGGVLTMGSVLAVTSNPTRTSPVKRGLFILDNVLGAPAPPPPPNIPALEAATVAGLNGRRPTLRETLAAHRDKPACVSCHQRLDPPGLALENFNALGLWREKEFGQPIDSTGTLVTGEKFADIRELKRILVRRHSEEFYRCLTEKMLTYAVGRGLEESDTENVDRIVRRVQQNDGRISALLTGIVESAPFQKRRNLPLTADRNRAAAQLGLGKTTETKGTEAG